MTPEQRAREFVETGFRRLGVASLEPYVLIVSELLNETAQDEREACAQIALAIDSGRGNEKEIARAIRARSAMTTAQRGEMSGCKCHGATFCPDLTCIGYEDDVPVYVRRDNPDGYLAEATRRENAEQHDRSEYARLRHKYEPQR